MRRWCLAMALSNPFAPRFAKVLFDIVLDTFAD